MRRLTVALIFLPLVCTASAFAEGEDSCQQTCPEGQALISFADGNTMRCVCKESGGEMEPVSQGDISCNDPEDDGTCE